MSDIDEAWKAHMRELLAKNDRSPHSPRCSNPVCPGRHSCEQCLYYKALWDQVVAEAERLKALEDL